MMSTPNDEASDHDSVDFKKVWVPSPHPSVISLSKSIHSSIHQNNESNLSILSYSYPSSNHSDRKSLIEEDYDEVEDNSDLVDILKNDEEEDFVYEFPLDHLEMIKVLGKGCMGKVNRSYSFLLSFFLIP